MVEDFDFLNQLKVGILYVAELKGIHPRDISLATYTKNKISEHPSYRQIIKHGNFAQIRDALFPLELPFRNDHEQSKVVADLILEYATEKGMAPQHVTWAEFRQFLNFRWGKNDKGLSAYIFSRVGGFPAIRDGYYPPLALEETVDKYRLQKQASMNRRLGSQMSEYQFTLDRLEEFSEKIFSGKVLSGTNSIKSSDPIKRVINLVLSDLHFGADLCAEETGHSDYGTKEEARRLSFVVQEGANYKLQYRAETELELLILGDIFQNSLHDPRDGAVLAEQMARSIHLLIQAIAYLAGCFIRVRVRFATGNHGRFLSRHKGRAVHGKFDSAETVVYYAIKSACSRLENVEFFLPKTPFVTYSVFGNRVFATHGDTVFNPGNPGQSIQISRIENQANRINASLLDSEEYSVFVVGHVHTASITYLGNGSTLITNGALIPVDPFAISLGIPESQAGQWLWESVADYPVGDMRFIRVGKQQDQDESLEQIIKPWIGF